MIPVGIVGVFFEEEIEVLFEGNIRFVGAMLLVTATLLYLTERVKIQAGSRVSFRNAMIIGLAQAVAILPGISRSGATISTALLLKIDRTNSARFSFLMVIPPILGANLLSIMKFVKGETVVESISGIALVAGFISAFVIGFLACKWMIRIVKNSKLYWFSIYCVIIGLIAIFIG
jgi:undecaprenyl-diphosphatase